ncbi:MAG TPA: helix-turn-helix domain-containing protein [Myxococcota bacterium]|nr:helix-turn-helix domain-containing protein [Myxococcota bacterium]
MVRPLAEQSYYELLEAAPEGTPQQIERAYRIARATYAPSSTAVYSVFSADECAAILRRIEEAWAVLSDARLRREYDARLRRSEPRPGVPTTPAPPVATLTRERERERERPPAPAPPLRPAAHEADLDASIAPDNGIFDGDVLRRIRVSLGIELEEISATTKINDNHLRAIEGNHYELLPPPVYLRGFLKQYAKCLSLDPNHVADSYTARMRESSARRG